MNSLRRINVHMRAAEAYSSLSHARRLKVGAVITKDDRVISIGYNGTPTGLDNNCEIEFVGELVTRPEVVHAEANAILFAAKNGIATEGCTLVITHSPCFECAKMIIQSGISRLFYKEIYRDKTPLDLLARAGVGHEQL